MNIKDMFSKFNKKNESVNELEEQKSLVISQDNSEFNIPSVFFEDNELLVEVGQWLDVLPSSKIFGSSSFSISTPLDPSELIESGVDSEIKRQIECYFGKLLVLAGVSKEEACVINNYNKKEFSFDITFVKENDKAKVNLRYGSFMDDGPEFIIDYKNVVRNFELGGLNTQGELLLQLQHFTVKNDVNGNSYNKLLSPYTSYNSCYNIEYRCDIEVGNPIRLSWEESRNFTFMLENEGKLQEYLLNTSFPIDINQLFKDVCSICNISKEVLESYPNFKISIVRLKDKKEVKLDEIILEHGVLKQFTLTKNGVTVNGLDKDTFRCVVSEYTYGMDVNKIIENILDSELFSTLSCDKKKMLKMNGE